MAMSDSRMQSLLGVDPVFASRVKMALLDVADGVLVEVGIPHHQARAAYAQRVLSNPDGAAHLAAIYLARSTNVVAAGISIEDTGITCAIDDAGLLSQVNAAWNILAGIDEGTAPA
jgi:hypothetical protein